MADEIAWVIVHRNVTPGGPNYWCGNGWSTDNQRAIRFAREIDAQRTLAGFDEDDPLPNEQPHRVEEHMWLDGPRSPSVSGSPAPSTEGLREALAKHQKFFSELWCQANEGLPFDIQYNELLELAVEHGLLIETEFDPEKHKPGEHYPEPGDPWYVESEIARAALNGVTQPAKPTGIEMTEAQIKHMVDRFLSWKLPTAFNPDGGISFERIAGASGPHPFPNTPVGTNLFSADQATAMVRHMLEGLPSPPASEVDIEALIVAAYKRGFQWGVENMGDPEATAYVGKAARDYADYTMNTPSTEVEKISTDTEVQG